MTTPLGRKLRYGMVGGGPGAFIGAVHRRAAEMDGLAELVAGAFSSDAERSRAQGAELHLDPARVYATFDAMAEAEAARPADDRLDFVSVVTPNHLHLPASRAFLERGIAVVCDKPLTTTLADAEDFCRVVAASGRTFALTHTYAGYPLVKHARAMVRDGALGEVRKVVVEYSQGWLTEPVERTGQRQAVWRTDPALAGAGALGDIGSHAAHMVRYVTGLEMAELLADVRATVPGRPIDDDANLLVRYANGARGVLHCSQICVGEENRFTLRVYGTRASVEWRQENPNELYVRRNDRPMETLRPGNAYTSPAALRATRVPPGHPEAYIEAFANVYANALRTIAARAAGREPDPLDLDFPTAQDGAVGVHFIEQAVRSGREGGVWVDMAYTPPA